MVILPVGTYTAADFALKKTLGKGTSGTARLAVRCTDSFPVVLKDIELAQADSDAETAVVEELKEVSILCFTILCFGVLCFSVFSEYVVT